MITKTVLYSPIHQDPKILTLFLKGIKGLETSGELDYWFTDDNNDPKSKELLIDFSKANTNTRIIPATEDKDIPYIKDDNNHQWNSELVDKIILLKNRAITQFINTDFDQIFFLDSDLILNPNTLIHLQSLKKGIVSEVFWTKFSIKGDYHPNVWDCNLYKFWSPENILRLRDPGVYEVGGLGACTLIQREPLEKGVNFSRISNLDFWGEDRHFCTRAICLGYPLFADTHYPPFHIYRNNMIDEASNWMKNGYKPGYFKTWLDLNWEAKIRKSFLPKGRKLIPRILRRIASILDFSLFSN